MRGNYVFTFLTDNEKMNVREIADNWRVKDINHQPPQKNLGKFIFGNYCVSGYH